MAVLRCVINPLTNYTHINWITFSTKFVLNAYAEIKKINLLVDLFLCEENRSRAEYI